MVEVGRTARLGCEVRGYPAPGTAWYKDETGDSEPLEGDRGMMKILQSWCPVKNIWWTAIGQTQKQVARWKPSLILER